MSTFISGQQVTCDMPVLLFFKNGKLIKNFRPAIFWPCAGIHSLLIYTLVILLFIKNTPFSIQGKLIRASIPRRLKFMAKSNRIPSLLKHRIIHTTILVAEKFFVNALRMIPIYIIVAVGAVGTFIANIIRIVSICIIGVEKGSEAAQLFHSYYGELYFIVWIITYLVILLLLSRRIRARLPIQG